MAISNNSTGLRPGVCTSSTRPTAPYEGQMIYETDTDLVYLWNGSAWVEIVSALTKAPRGVMGYAKSTADSTSISTTTADVPGMSITFTAAANRLYRATFECFYSVSLNSQNQFFITDGSNNMVDQVYAESNLQFNPIALIYVFTTTAGSKTYKVRATTSAGTMTIYGATSGNRSYSFVIEDIGAA